MATGATSLDRFSPDPKRGCLHLVPKWNSQATGFPVPARTAVISIRNCRWRQPFHRLLPALSLTEAAFGRPGAQSNLSSTLAASGREPGDGFDVVGLGKQIEHFQGIKLITVLEQKTQVPSQGGRTAGNVNETFGAQRQEQLKGGDAHPRAGRVQHDQVRFGLRAAAQEVEGRFRHHSDVPPGRKARVSGEIGGRLGMRLNRDHLCEARRQRHGEKPYSRKEVHGDRARSLAGDRGHEVRQQEP